MAERRDGAALVRLAAQAGGAVKSPRMPSFFAGLLPNESQRDAAAQALCASSANDFALLDRLAGDVAGALQLLPPGAAPITIAHEQHPIPLDDAGLIRVLDTLPVRQLLTGEEGLRLSLAGAQSKVPVVLLDV